MSITTLPTPPSRQDPANFSTRADEFLGALPTFATEANALAVEVNDDAAAAAGSASTATTQAGIATTQAGIATTQAGIAAGHASAALGHANTASGAAASAIASFDQFDARYLGAKASDPSTDNEGNPLVAGALYYKTGDGMRVWTGSAWSAAYIPTTGMLTVGDIGNTVQPYDADLTSWAGISPSAKQDTLVSGTNIKTINGGSVLGSGDLVIGGGSWVLLSTVTASNSATVDLETTIDSTYDCYVVIANRVFPSTDGAFLWSRLKVNGAYLSSGYSGLTAYPLSTNNNTFDSIGQSGAAQILIGEPAGAASETSLGGINLRMSLYDPANTTVKTSYDWQGSHISQGGIGYRHALLLGSGRVDSTLPVTGIRFLFSTGNVASGVFRLYGIKKI